MDQPSEKGPALPSSQVQARACLPALERCEPSALALTVLAMGRLRQSWPLESLQTASSTLIYANPCKAESHIKYVADVGAILTNIDSKEETEKTCRWHPKHEPRVGGGGQRWKYEVGGNRRGSGCMRWPLGVMRETRG